MSKKLMLLLSLSLLSSVAFGGIQEGKYVGRNAKTGGTCSLTFSDEGDYAYHRNVEYRITVHSKGPFIKCKDNEGIEFNNCASGAQTNARNQDERSLYILGIESSGIQKIYFQDSDYNSTNDVVCINLRKV